MSHHRWRLLTCDLHLQAKDKQHMTPLHMAATYGYPTVTSLLLKLFVPLRCVDEEQQTPLHSAAKGGHDCIVRMLLAVAEEESGTDTVKLVRAVSQTGGSTHNGEEMGRLAGRLLGTESSHGRVIGGYHRRCSLVGGSAG